MKRRVFIPIRASELSSDSKAPDRILVWKDGETRLRSGVHGTETLRFDSKSALRVMSDFRDGGVNLIFDYEHQSVPDAEGNFGDPKGRAEAAGWITDLEFVEREGLWAAVEWTDEARELIESRKYRYYSPAWIQDEKGRPTRLLSVALTNTPRTRDCLPLAATDVGGSGMEMIFQIAAKLGINEADLEGKPPDAILQMILDAIGALMDGGGDDEGDAEGEEAKETMASIRKILNADKDATAKTIVASIRTLAEAEPDPKKYAPVAVVMKLKERLEAVEGQLEDTKIGSACDKFIARMVEEGKCVEANESSFRKLYKADPEGTEKDSKNWPTIVAKGSAPITDPKENPTNSDRKAVIATAAREWSSAPEKGMIDRASFVDEVLREKDLEPLTADERKSL